MKAAARIPETNGYIDHMKSTTSGEEDIAPVHPATQVTTQAGKTTTHGHTTGEDDYNEHHPISQETEEGNHRESHVNGSMTVTVEEHNHESEVNNIVDGTPSELQDTDDDKIVENNALRGTLEPDDRLLNGTKSLKLDTANTDTHTPLVGDIANTNDTNEGLNKTEDASEPGGDARGNTPNESPSHKDSVDLEPPVINVTREASDIEHNSHLEDSIEGDLGTSGLTDAERQHATSLPDSPPPEYVATEPACLPHTHLPSHQSPPPSYRQAVVQGDTPLSFIDFVPISINGVYQSFGCVYFLIRYCMSNYAHILKLIIQFCIYRQV